MSPLSPSLFLKPPVPVLGGWLVAAAGQGLVSLGYPSERMGNVVMPWVRALGKGQMLSLNLDRALSSLM